MSTRISTSGRRTALLSLAAGLVSATGFAPLGLLPLALAALVVWLFLVREAPTLGRALARGWWFGLGHFTLGLNWIATAFTFQAAMPAWLGWIAVVLLSLYLAIYPAIAAGLAWRWRGRGKTLRADAAFALCFAAGWIVTEWLRATMFTGFAWNLLSAMLAARPGLPVLAGGLLPLIGSYALSGLIVLAAGMLLAALRRPSRDRIGWAALALLGPLLLGLALHRAPPAAQGPAFRIVQPDIDQSEKWNEAAERRNFAKLARLSARTGEAPRLLLWPEAAVPDYIGQDAYARRRLARLLGARDMLLTGASALEYRRGELVAARNSLFLIDPAARTRARYDKAHLVPYGEYLPMRPLLSAFGLSRLAPGDLDFWPGPGPRTIAVPGFGRIGVQICYEIIFSGDVVDEADRPDLLFNPSNDAWFGAWGPPQHLAQARLRAAEEAMPVLRATPTGISALIAADGALVRHLPWRSAGVIDGRLPTAGPPTPFARIGNYAALGVVLLLIAGAIACRRGLR